MRIQTRQCGVTLIELMVTLAVAAVLISIAVPSFRSLMAANKLDTAANGVVNAVRVARMEAIKRNGSAQFCSNSAGANAGDSLGGACGAEGGAVWAMGGNGPGRVLAAIVIATPVRINGNLTALRFGAQGTAWKVGTNGPYAGTVVDLCTSQRSTDNHRVVAMTAGSILVTTTTSGACP